MALSDPLPLAPAFILGTPYAATHNTVPEESTNPLTSPRSVVRRQIDSPSNQGHAAKCRSNLAGETSLA